MDQLDSDIIQAMAGNEEAEETETEQTEEVQQERLESDSNGNESEVSQEELTAPVNWSVETREYFGGLDDSGKQLFMEHYKNLERGYNKKYEDTAKERKTYEAVTEVFEPIRNDFMQAGLDDAGAARYLVGIYQQLAQDPADTILKLAEQTGVDLSSLVNVDYPDYDFDESYDPRYDNLQQQLNETTKQLETFQTQAKQEQLQQLTQQINAFKSEKDDHGNIKHPFFDQVQAQMTQIFNAGAASNLDQAYKMAVAADSELSAKQEQLIRESEAKRKAEEAKRAGKAARGVRGSSSTSVENNESMDLREMIAQQVYAARRS